jgi:hypothetical protein
MAATLSLVAPALAGTNALTDAAAAAPAQGVVSTTPPTLTKTKPQLVSVPTGTPVVVRLDLPISSQTAKTDDTFTFTVENDVIVSGMLIVAKGAAGQGHVQEAEAAKMMGRSGILILAYDWVTAKDGNKVHVSGLNPSVGGNNTETAVGAGVAAGLAGSIVPFAGFATFAMKGKKAEIGTDHTLTVFVPQACHVTSDMAGKYNDGFAH